jgi:glycosyltransferase involved in cell wall biosynthesis
MSKCEPTEVCHFLNGFRGGVYHVVKNLVMYGQNSRINNRIVYVIETEKFPDWASIPNDLGCDELVFKYSRMENLNHVFRRLASTISPQAILVAHDWFELGMVTHLGMPNRLVYFLHGNYAYYFSLLEKHLAQLDLVLCVSKQSYQQMVDYQAVGPRFHHFRFPVRDFPAVKKNFGTLHIAVIAENLRDPNKGLSLIRDINSVLESHSIPVVWHLAGNGFMEDDLGKWWGTQSNLPVYYGYLNQSQLEDFYGQANIFILPSQNEGVPVTLVESMKAGLIPIIASWSDNVSDLVIDGYTGYVLDDTLPASYAAILMQIHERPSEATEVSLNASALSSALYNPHKQVVEFETILLSLTGISNRTKELIYGSRLDAWWVPNFVSIFFRSLKSKWKPPFFQLS